MDIQVTTNSQVKQAVPFFAVADINRSLNFYVEGLQFEITRKWIDEGKLRWCWLQLGGAAVMLQEYKKHGHDSWNPEGKVGIGVSIYFICDDALTIYRQAKAKGVALKKPFVGNGMWVIQLADPDGYQLSFESPTNEPEDSIFSE
jgi:lactoylglutathione lyase